MSVVSPQFSALISRPEFCISKGLLLKAYHAAIAEGGLEEQDFSRPPETSYNPRPARAAYILVRNCRITDPIVIASGMIAIVEEKSAVDFLGYKLPQDVLNLCTQAQRPINELLEMNSDVIDRNAKVLALCCRLDRARHFHLSSFFHQTTKREAFVRETQSFLDLAQREALPLLNELTQWIRRASLSSPPADQKSVVARQ